MARNSFPVFKHIRERERLFVIGVVLAFFFILAINEVSAALLPFDKSITASSTSHYLASTTIPSPNQFFEEEATEGGFILYDRRLIAATMGRTRQILLTFDDGPNPNTTPKILDILKRWNIKAIFFVVGMNARKYPDIVRRISAEGHIIGNHTWYHLNLKKFGTERIQKEIRDTNDLIQKLTGVRPHLFRPPYGALNASIIEILRREGMDIMLWTFDPRDWRNRSMVQTVASLKKQIHLGEGGKGGIILLHDTLPSTVASLEPLLEALAQNNLLPSIYQIVHAGNRGYWAPCRPYLCRTLQYNSSFTPDAAKYPMLSNLLKSNYNAKFSSMALLKAKKSGQLLTMLLTQSF